MPLIDFTDKGLFCKQGNFYIDPWKPVAKAIITHAHSDHARYGHQQYLCHTYTKPILQLRLGNNNYQTVEWGEKIYINGVQISLHPAGHIIGSSQIRLEYKNEIWVVSGDYKTENDGISEAFEIIPCNTFITESTFGLPIYKWKTQQEIFSNIQNWISENKKKDKSSILIGYSLGKAQRLVKCVAEISDTIFVHGAVWNIHQTLLNAGYPLPAVQKITAETPKALLKNCIVIAPSSAESTPWLKRFAPYNVGVCSGWMQVRGNIRRRNIDAGFALSDHADWPGLLQTIKATGAEKVFVTHGFQAAFSRYLNEINIPAAEVKTIYGQEEEVEAITEVQENIKSEIEK